MNYCYENAVPHSRFLGGPDEWLPTDRAKVMAYALMRAERCFQCGTAPWEWEQDNQAYVAVLESCPGCLRRELKSEETAANPQKGTRVTLIPREKAEMIAANPAAFAIDSPQKRKEARRRRQAEEAARQ